jgi:uncharacterized protein (DUF2147 family)
MLLTAKIAAAGALYLALTGSAAAGPDPAGLWVMENGKVMVRVSKCGNRLCGTIVGLDKPLDKRGRPKLDKHNPNPALRERPLIGLRILYDMKPAGDGQWQGAIYNASDGRVYSSYMKLKGSEMQVKGCVAILCKSMDFYRAD